MFFAAVRAVGTATVASTLSPALSHQMHHETHHGGRHNDTNDDILYHISSPPIWKNRAETTHASPMV